jgi:hypothetical protein
VVSPITLFDSLPEERGADINIKIIDVSMHDRYELLIHHNIGAIEYDKPILRDELVAAVPLSQILDEVASDDEVHILVFVNRLKLLEEEVRWDLRTPIDFD